MATIQNIQEADDTTIDEILPAVVGNSEESGMIAGRAFIAFLPEHCLTGICWCQPTYEDVPTRDDHIHFVIIHRRHQD